MINNQENVDVDTGHVMYQTTCNFLPLIAGLAENPGKRVSFSKPVHVCVFVSDIHQELQDILKY